MSYAVKLEKVLISRNLKIAKKDLINSSKIPNGYILKITNELRLEYPLLEDYIISCYKKAADFSNSYGFTEQVAAKFPKALKEKFIIDSFFHDGYVRKDFNGWETGHYLLLTEAGIPFGIFGIADKAGFPLTYQTMEHADKPSFFELPHNALLFSIVIGANYRRRGLSTKITQHFLKVFKNYPIYETISVANLANQNAVQRMRFNKIGKVISSDPLKASILLYTYQNPQ